MYKFFVDFGHLSIKITFNMLVDVGMVVVFSCMSSL